MSVTSPISLVRSSLTVPKTVPHRGVPTGLFPWGPEQVVVAVLFGLAVLTLVVLVARWRLGRNGLLEVNRPPTMSAQRTDHAATFTRPYGEAGR